MTEMKIVAARTTVVGALLLPLVVTKKTIVIVEVMTALLMVPLRLSLFVHLLAVFCEMCDSR